MLEQFKKVKIEDVGLKTDEEAIQLVKKLKTAVSTIAYYNDGIQAFIIGNLDDVLLDGLIVKQRLENVEQQIKKVNEKVEQLYNQLSLAQTKQLIEQKETIKSNNVESFSTPPFPSSPLETEMKSLSDEISLQKTEPQIIKGLPFKQQTTETVAEEKLNVPMKLVSFKCPNCEKTFSENIPVKHKVISVICPYCNFQIFKQKRWTRKKKILTVVAVLVGLFIIWLFLP